MSHSRETIRKIAELARIELNEADLESLTHELDTILDHVARLAELDLEAVPPTVDVLDGADVALRSDAPAACLPTETALALAPARHTELFEVPRIID